MDAIKKVKALKQEIRELRQQTETLLDTAEQEDRALSEEETTSFRSALDTLEAKTREVEDLERYIAANPERAGSGYQGRGLANLPFNSEGSGDGQTRGGHGGDGDTARDPTVVELLRHRLDGDALPSETRGWEMQTGESGGVLVPQQYGEEILRIEPAEEVVMPRGRVMPAGSPPDAAITMPAFTQGGDGVFGGVTMTWIEEGGEKPETDGKLHTITLQPHELAGTTEVTDKLLRNAAAAEPFITGLLQDAIRGERDYQFLRGDGVGKPLGLINSPGALDVNRATANTVEWDDIRAMRPKMLPRSIQNAVWLANHELEEHLLGMEDNNDNLIFVQGDATRNTPAQLNGRPIVFTDILPAPGNRGDLMLADLRYYIIKQGSGPFVDASRHVRFKENKTVIKVFTNIDGQLWVREPLATRNAAGHVSPLVILN